MAVETQVAQVVAQAIEACACGCGRDVDTGDDREYAYYDLDGEAFYDIDCLENVFWPDEPTGHKLMDYVEG